MEKTKHLVEELFLILKFHLNKHQLFYLNLILGKKYKIYHIFITALGADGIAATFVFDSNNLFKSLPNVIKIFLSVFIAKLSKLKSTMRPKGIL